MNKRAAKLLELLEEHVVVQRHAGAHYGTAANKGFRSSALEKEDRDDLQTKQKALHAHCEKAGFEFALLLDMIPPPFKTTGLERQEILADLKQYAEKKYG